MKVLHLNITVLVGLILALLGGIYTVFSVNSLQNVRAESELKIVNAEEFMDFIDNINSGNNYAGTLVSLGADIDLSSVENYSCTNVFAGILDGCGYKISGMNLAFTKQTGMFARLSGEVKNLELEAKVEICESSETSVHYVGGIAGAIMKKNENVDVVAVNNCYVKLDVLATDSPYTNVKIGAICGNLNSSRQINNIYVTGDWVYIDGASYGALMAVYNHTGSLLNINAIIDITFSDILVEVVGSIEITEVSAELIESNGLEHWCVEDGKVILNIMKNTDVVEPEPEPVEKVAVEVEILSKESVYGEDLAELDFVIKTADVLEADLGLILEIENASSEFLVGTYNIVVKSYNADKYDLTFNSATYEILPREISVILANNSGEYTGSEHIIEYNINGILEVDEDDVSVELKTINLKEVGTYLLNFEIKGAKSSNYVIKNENLYYSIYANEIVVEWGESELIFNGKVQAPLFNIDLDESLYNVVGSGVNVGEYTLRIELLTDEYTIINPEFNYSIIALPIDIIWSVEDEYIYNGSEQGPSYVGVPEIAEGFIIFSGLEVDAGEYEASVTTENKNFAINNGTCAYEIKKYNLEITWGSDKLVYSGEEIIPEYNFDMPAFLDKLDLNTSGAGRDVGKYIAELSLADENFEVINSSFEYEILPLAINIVWDKADEYIYNGSEQGPSYTGMPEIAEEFIIFSGLEVNAGEYEAKVSTENKNFAINNGTCVYEIKKCNLEITWGSDELVYSGEEIIPEYNFDMPAFLDKLDLNTSGAGIDAGKYVVELSLADENFEIINNSFEYEIMPLEINVVWSKADEYIYNGSEQGPSYVGVPEIAEEFIIFSGLEINAGEYEAKVSTENKNYAIINGTCAYEIKKYNLEIVWGSDELVYSGEELFPVYEFDMPAFLDKLDLNTSGAGRDAGKYIAELSLADENFEIINNRFEYEILPLEINVVWSKADEYIYNGSEQGPSYVGVPEIAEEFIIFSGLEINAGEYEAKVSTENKNYAIINGTCVYEIKKCNLEITWGSDELVYSGEEIIPEYNFDMPAFLDKLDLNTSGAGRDVGKYIAELSLADENFEVINSSFEYEILPLAINIVWDKADEYIYNGSEQGPSYVGVPEIAEEFIIFSGLEINAGEYEASVSTENKNFAINNGTCAYEIKKLEINLIWSNLVQEYNGTELCPSIGGIGDYAIELGIVMPKFCDAGSYDIEVNTENKNFILNNNIATFIIEPKSVSVIWSGKTFTYNGEERIPSASCVENIEIEVLGGGVGIGNYLAEAKSKNNNYIIENNTFSYKIEPFYIDLVWDNLEIEFCNKECKPSFSGLPDFADESKFCLTDGAVNVGTYEIECEVFDENFVINNPKQEFRIVSKKINVNWDSDLVLNYCGKEIIPDYELELPNYVTELETAIESSGVNVGIYTVKIKSLNNNFELINNSVNYEIVACVVDVIWEDAEYIFNGEVQKPKFRLNLPSFVSEIDSKMIGVGKNVNRYSAVLQSEDDNFVFSNNRIDYEIKPYILRVEWIAEELIFNDNVQKPKYEVELPTFIDSLEFELTGSGLNAGNYTAMLKISANAENGSNFKLQNNIYEYEIKPFGLILGWSNLEFEYCNEVVKPSCIILNGEGFTNLPTVEVLGGQEVVGEYTASASIDDDNFVLVNDSCDFSILPQVLEIICEEILLNVKVLQGEFVDNLKVEEVKRSKNLPYGYSYFLGFKLTINEIVENSTLVKLASKPFDILEEEQTNYQISITLPKNLIIPENVELFLMNEEPVKLDWVLNENVISFNANELGEIYFAYYNSQEILWTYLLIFIPVGFILLVCIIFTIRSSNKKIKFKKK